MSESTVKPHSYIKEYADRIRSGEIVAGSRLKQGIRRFLDDFDRFIINGIAE